MIAEVEHKEAVGANPTYIVRLGGMSWHWATGGQGAYTRVEVCEGFDCEKMCSLLLSFAHARNRLVNMCAHMHVPK